MAPMRPEDESSENLLKSTSGVIAIALSSIPNNRPDYTPSIHDQPGKPLRRFYLRGLVSLLVPPIVTAYYFAIWYKYLNASPDDSPVSFGPRGGLWMYYSWFLIGVIGLGLSQYGLEAIEAQMLTEPAWAVDNAMLVMIHGDHSWSGPGGWFKAMSNLTRFKPKGRIGLDLLPSRLWLLLASLTLPVFIALPLSGLVINFGDGYVKTGARPEVVGFGWDTFNDRTLSDASNGAQIAWQYAFGAKIPGMGVIYTPEHVDRSNASLKFLIDLPSTLPADTGVDEIFLIPQSDTPVEGESFGLALKYSCTIVENLNDFSILRDRNASKLVSSGSNGFSYTTPKNDSIFIYNQTDAFSPKVQTWTTNLQAVIEIGYSRWPKNISVYSVGPTNDCYFNEKPQLYGRSPGIHDEEVWEVLLWQSLYEYSGSSLAVTPRYNNTLGSNITSLYGAYKTDSFGANTSMSAIGVRCSSSSALGNAFVSGKHGTFSNFIASDTPIKFHSTTCPRRFGPAGLINIFGTMFNKEWLSTFFTSVAAQPLFYASWADDDGSGNPYGADSGTSLQLSMLQPEQLRTSLLRAYAAYAVQLMYNGGQGFTSADGAHDARFTHPNLTAYRADTVLQGGVVPPIIPGVLLGIWALGSVVLTCFYGFRHRWAATLDGYSLFVFGTDLASEVKNKGGLGATLDAEHSEVLRKLPGMVGDREPGGARGKIGLVGTRAEGVARKALSRRRRFV